MEWSLEEVEMADYRQGWERAWREVLDFVKEELGEDV